MRYMYVMLVMIFGLSFSIADAKNLPTKKELKEKEAALNEQPLVADADFEEDFGYRVESKDDQWEKKGRLRVKEPTSKHAKRKVQKKKDDSREKSGRSHRYNSSQKNKPLPRAHRYSPNK